MATQLDTRRENPMTVIRQNLTAMAPEFKAALPAHISVDKFTRVAMTAINNNPALAEADRKSLFGSIVRLAQDGLLPDGREAAIVIFNTKKGNDWVKAAQAMPMIAGILKKIRQSGDVSKISAQVVYENDQFVWHLGFNEDVTHVPPPLDQPRGKPIGAYATAVLKDGARLLEVMSLEEIEKVRNVSRSKDKGPWVDWFSEMARKTVMRRLSKRLPMSTDLDDAFERDETMAHTGTQIDGGEVIAMPEPISRLEALEAQIATDTPADEQRGEPVTLASAKDEIDRCEIVADVNNCVAALLEHLDEDDGAALREHAIAKTAELTNA